MMTIEVKINGALIGFAYVRNLCQHFQNPESSRYLAEYYQPGKPLFKTKELLHKRSEGAEVLVKKVFRWITSIESETP